MGIPKKKKPPKNKKAESMTLVDFSEMKIPAICVYNRPADFPDKIIARVIECDTIGMTNVYAEYDTLEDCQKDIAAAGFNIVVPRSPQDTLCIVETYFRGKNMRKETIR